MDTVPDYNIQELLFFPGKDLSDVNIAGKRIPHRPIRIAIGVEGVYKFEPDKDELITFWSYSDITDWNYSGYSFTLNLKSKVDYHVRTNDGPSISHWIETFSKSPAEAIVTAREFKALGDFNPINKQPVFYTLNTRKKHGRNSTDIHSRLLSAYGVDRKHHSSTQSIDTERSSGNDLKRWSTGVSVIENGKNSAQRSASADVLDKTNVVNESRAKSMECLSNGTSNIFHHIPNQDHVTVHSNGETSHLLNTSSIEHDEDVAPAVPPRIASLKSSPLLMQNVSSVSPDQSHHDVMIQVSDGDTHKPAHFSKKPQPHTYEEIEIGVPSKYNKLEVLSNDMQLSGSGDYDHLFPGKKHTHRPVIRRKKSREQDDTPTNSESAAAAGGGGEQKKEVPFTSIRRNGSLPPMILHSPVIVVDKPDLSAKDCESGVSDSEMDEPVSPLPGEYCNEEGVVMRQKPSDTFDPFVDLLSAPPSKSRLRWSQELNPLYDYIRGVKISPKIGYDSLAENTIQEEESSTAGIGDDTASICSSDRRSSSDSQFEGLIFVPPQSAPNTLQRVKRMPHNYEEVVFGEPSSGKENDVDIDGGRNRSDSGSRPLSEHYSSPHVGEIASNKPQTLRSSPLRRLKSSEAPFAVTPPLNKRVLQRKSKTVRSSDDTNAPQGRQRARQVADTMRDFSYITREYRVFFIKMPSGHLISEVVSINKPVSVLMDKLAELLGSKTTESYSLFVEGSILTTMKEGNLEFGELQPAKAHVNTSSVSLTQLVDNNSLADQGDTPILLKNNLPFRVQGITTARILRLDDSNDTVITDLQDTVRSVKNDFHKAWLSVVQGNQPTTLDNAVKLAAMQYQAYFLERTAENSVIGFCRPTEFLPAEFAGVRAIEGKIYKEQEKLKSKSQSQIQKSYVDYCRSLPTSTTLFFPVREARRRLLHSAKLKPVLLGVNKRGIMRVCPKTKEVLESWEYPVLKNWAYSRRTFVVAFSNKNYPVESNQAKWISDLVDFHVHSIMHSSLSPPSSADQ